MFNPLQQFQPHYLVQFIRKGAIAFVKQSYQRGRKLVDDAALTYVLIHFEKELAAQQYFDVLKNDVNRELFWVNNARDLNLIREMLDSGNAYMMLKKKDAEIKARKILDKRIKSFIESKLNWHPSRQDEVLFKLDVQFGEVYAKLKFRSKEIKVKLEEIEDVIIF